MKNTTTRILILAILAACLIGCGCAGAVSAGELTLSSDDPTTIEKGDTVTFSYTYDANYTYSASLQTGNEESSDIVISDQASGKFTYTFDTAGTYTVTLTATNTTSGDKTNSNKLSITVKEPETTKTNITSVTITLSDPVKGASAPSTITASGTGVESSASVTWSPADTTFKASTEYTATVIFSANENYQFTSETTVTVSDSTITNPTLLDSGAKLKITKSFSATAAETTTTTSTPSVTTFSANTTEGTNPLTVKFTYTLANTTSPTITLINAATNGVLESPTSNTEVTHTFTTAGTYLVRLKVDDGSNTVYSSNNITIKVNAPATKTAISSVAVSGITAPVANANPSPNCTTGAATYTATITWYKKGSSSAMSTSDKFESNTQYTVKAVLTPATNYFFNTSLSNTSAKINNNVPTEFKRDSDTSVTMSYTFPATAKLSGPSITFSVDPAKPKIPSNANTVKVTYTYTITGNPTSATLYFGEGTEVDLGSAGSDGKITGTKTHEFSNIGTFTAYISARNANDVSQQNIVIPVGQEILASIIEAGPLTGTAPLAVTVNDKSTGTITTRTWNFGDGSVSSGEKSTSHTYEKPGTYTITLTVSDGKDSDMSSKTITVTEKKTDDDEEEITNSTVNYEPFITLGDIGIPSPMDLIAEFVRLFQCMINFDNYTLFSFDNSTKEDEDEEEE